MDEDQGSTARPTGPNPTDGRKPGSALAPPARLAAAEMPSASRVLALQVGVVVIGGLYFARGVLIPITLAILLAFLLVPVVALLRRIRVPRVPAILLSVILALGLALAI